MLPSAFSSLSDPCLPDFWTNIYTAAPGAITMGAVIAIFLVEFSSTRYLAFVDGRIDRTNAVVDRLPTTVIGSSSSSVTGMKVETPAVQATPTTGGDHFGHHHFVPAPIEGGVFDRTTERTQKLGVLILEAGIIFHSVFIGLTLAVSSGSDFISLFITIIFHRTPRNVLSDK
jgi:solute carrier family 39 (zinc transporter), member 1/2/3